MRIPLILALLTFTVACDLLAPAPATTEERRRRGNGDDEVDTVGGLRCDSSGDCNGGEVCEAGRCAVVCDGDGDCPDSAAICSGGGRCVECIGSGDCDGNDVCNGGFCQAPGEGEGEGEGEPGEGEGEGEAPSDISCVATIATVNGESALGQSVVDVGDTVGFSARASLASGRSITSFQWALTTRPTEATSAALSQASSSSPTVTVSTAGLYTVRLTITDDGGASATCQTSVTALASTSPTDVLVQLTWDDDSADLDVHLNRGTPPTWCSATDDCYYGNRTPTWGASLDIDDLSGFGPENLSLRGAADGTYTIGVGVYQADTTVTATMKVFIGGVLAFEGDRALTQDVEWLPAIIRVQGGAPSVTEVDGVGQQAGSCWGSATTTTTPGTGGFGESCSTAGCVDGLVCGLVSTCNEICFADNECDICEADTGRRCTCTLVAGLGFCQAN